MTITKDGIRSWLAAAKREGATHVLVVCDTFDHEDYPVSVMPGEDVRAKAKPYQAGENMQALMEVYSLKRDIEAQLNEHRAFHYD